MTDFSKPNYGGERRDVPHVFAIPGSVNLGAISCTHFVGFRDDRYWNAVAVFGRPHFIHRWWDKRARREIADCDTVIFADGDWRQEPSRFNAPDIDEANLVECR